MQIFDEDFRRLRYNCRNMSIDERRKFLASTAAAHRMGGTRFAAVSGAARARVTMRIAEIVPQGSDVGEASKRARAWRRSSPAAFGWFAKSC